MEAQPIPEKNWRRAVYYSKFQLKTALEGRETKQSFILRELNRIKFINKKSYKFFPPVYVGLIHLLLNFVYLLFTNILHYTNYFNNMSKSTYQISSQTASSISQDNQPQLITTKVVENGQTVQKCTIGKYQYSKKDFLGEGFSSCVYKATLLNNRKERFAIKVIDLSKFNNNEKQLLESEIDIIRSLNHDNIIRCVDVYKTDVNYFLVTEYCPHGDLNELIQLQKYITEDRAIEIMKQILNGYKYLTSKNIIHRDLKPANVMRFGSQWKIGDFGFSCYCKEEYILEKIYVGTPTYMPPESLQLNKYSYRSDIFALGIIFYEMLTGQTPWPAKDQRQLLDSMKENSLEIPRFLVSQQSKMFLEKSIVLDYYQRMSKDELRKFTFDNVDLEKVSKLKPRVVPCLKRELSKSGKKSCLFATSNKFSKNSFFMPIIKQDVELAVKNRSNYPKKILELSKPLFAEQQPGQNSPVTTKCLKQNADVIIHELDFVRMLVSLVHGCQVLGLEPEEEASLCLLIYNIGLKMLKMVGTRRQNYYRLTKWDIFRQSQKYRSCTSLVFNYSSKIETEYESFKNKLDQTITQKFNTDYPELVGNGSLNFKIYAKIYDKLCQFLTKNIQLTNQEHKNQQLMGKKCYCIRQIIDLLATIKYRAKRQQEVKGFGLKTKPECLSLKYVVWSEDALRLSMKQLETLCKCKIDKQ